MKVIILFLIGLVVIKTLPGAIMSKTEEPIYQVVATEGNIQIREYAPMVIAEVEVSGERKSAINAGFKILADYIFGNNTKNIKMEMTAPVINQRSEKIAMTAPVIQEKHMDNWKVRFVMPKEYTLDTLPKPNSSLVNLISVPARRFAVIRFSGTASDESIKLNTNELQNYITKHQLNSLSGPILAFYNPPWTLPFLRRNEIMIEIRQ